MLTGQLSIVCTNMVACQLGQNIHYCFSLLTILLLSRMAQQQSLHLEVRTQVVEATRASNRMTVGLLVRTWIGRGSTQEAERLALGEGSRDGGSIPEAVGSPKDWGGSVLNRSNSDLSVVNQR